MYTTFFAPLLAALLLTGTTIAQTPDWSNATRIEIDLSNFKYTPETIRLRQGQPYLFHFANRSSGGHNFTAKAFFAAATVAPEDSKLILNGKIELDGGKTADIRLIAPGPGSYEVHCSHFMHSALGMTGRIVVE
ncbi:copper-binding protein [Sphingomonas oleivorans]|uniref:Copper-binding protein n=1 Tax=Sphingomonas oleivorans TaxID=1735121 RepID=A0A2T5FYN2_9SPHN|nr:cupredoxin domain-containing protein [Sphingomonas oleivorans]PTQ11594.1 copper-binding protein [Sphingomonas oleivorans]